MKGTLNKERVARYLTRIGCDLPACADLPALQKLQLAHLQHIPFENLDIQLGNKITLGLDALFTKVVENRRGGFCYELNSLFCELLRSLGFQVRLLSARVHNDGQYGKFHAHTFIMVELGNEFWLTDVGFGDAYRQPVKLDGSATYDGFAYFKVREENQLFVLMSKLGSEFWSPKACFSLDTYSIADFAEMCEWTQSAPESAFTRKNICSIATDSGRLTLSNGRFIETVRQIKRERAVQSEREYRDLLLKHFGISLDSVTDLSAFL